MGRKSKPPSEAERIVLNAVLDLKAATPLTEQMLERRGSDVEVDSGRVQRLGGQCLQVLLAARATWKADGKRFLVINIPPMIVETLILLGVSTEDLTSLPETMA